jgi:HlyD family secretion protein
MGAPRGEMRPSMAEKRNRTKTAVVIIVVLAVLVITALATRGKVPVVPVVEITREDLLVSITSNGKVEPIDPEIARAEFSTFVDKVMATEGQTVRRGETVLTLDSADIRSQLAKARADLLSAEHDFQNARAGGPPDEMAQLSGDLQAAQVEVANLESNEKALEDLVSKHAATEDELAQNRASLAKARAHLQALEARKKDLEERSSERVDAARLRVSQARELVDSLDEKVHSATVVATTQATLYSLPVRAGDYVKVGDTLAEMADLSRVRVRAFVDEPDLGLLEPAQTVEVTWDAKPGKTWTGLTEQVPKQVVPRGPRSVGEVLCSIDNKQRELLPNTNVQVEIRVRQRLQALVVPRGAVRIRGKGQRFVWVFDGQRVHRRDISVGVSNASNYEVLSGLVANERVAEPVDQKLKDGMEVRAEEGP